MDFVLKFLTLGLYGLLTKKRSLKQTVSKKKYREDGTLKKEIIRDTDYDSEDAPEIDSDNI